MEIQYRELGDIHNVRWVASKVRAMVVLQAAWSFLVAHVEDLAIEGRSVDERAVSQGLLATIKSERFVRLLHFLLDLLTIAAQLSLFFQRNDLPASQIPDVVRSAQRKLSDILVKPRDGCYVKQFLDDYTDG